MVDPDDPHVVDLRDEDPNDPAPPTEIVRTRRPRLAAGLAAAVVLVVVALALLDGDERSDSGAATPIASEAALPPVATEAPAAGAGALASTPAPLATAAAILAVDTPMTLHLATRPTEGGPVAFVRVDSATGAATYLDNRSLLGLAPFDDLRFFGSETAVAALIDGSYLTLSLGADRVEIVSLVHVGATAAATPLGLDALSTDGRFAWVESPYGFFRWDLVEDRIVGRWLDRDGDLDRLPVARLAVDSGLIVEAGGDTYLVEDTSARRLDIDGEVVAGAGDWVLTRGCDETLDCGDLELVDLASSARVALRDERFRQRCGLMAPAPPGSSGDDDPVVVVLQRFGSSAVVVAGRDGIASATPLHPLTVGCLDATALADGRLVVFSDTTIAFVVDGEVEVVTTFALGRILAGTATAVIQ